MSEPLTQRTGANVDEFIASCTPDGRRDDAVVVKALFEKITGAPAEMWGPTIVGFGEYHYEYKSGHSGNCMAIGFSPRKANMVFYGLNIPETEAMLPKLGTFKLGAWCLYVGRLSNIDLDVLADLIRTAWGIGSYQHDYGHTFTRLR